MSLTRTYTYTSLIATYKWLREHPTGMIKVDWCTTLNAKEWRRWFRQCLMDKINRNLPMTGRKWSDEYQTGLLRDKRIVAECCQRVRHYQFNTPEIKSRLGHLLSNYGE